MTEETLFYLAQQQPDPAARAAFLDQVCVNQPELRARLDKLLQAHDAPARLLDCPALPAAPTSDPQTGALLDRGEQDHTASQAAVNNQIGPYKLLQKLGEGGMGAVWVAEQTEPVKRRVALKLIKAGMDSAQVLRRFEAERQALALMDHGNIARALDAGTTPQGRPYFVMELVKGVPINRYCDELHLTLPERLALFVPVCQAIQHAHQKGIIHRDIKPNNVLVAIQDGKPVPKVIDFGVAKALHQRLTDESLYTEIGQIVGTLEYMSPEQAELSALDIDTRADVYALGVLLYELLTGTTPLNRKQLGQGAYAEMLRLIKEEEPPKPSTRLSESKESLANVAARRRTEPAKLTRAVRGDLDWIVMKALEKDRTRRYDTANELAMDVQRHLADEPVLACPPSAAYRLRKFVRRNQGAVLAAVLVLLVLVGGSVGTTWGMFQVDAARRDEVEHRQIAQLKEREARAEQVKALAAAERERLAKERESSQRKLAEANEKKAVRENQIAQSFRRFLLKDLLLQADVAYQAETLGPLGGEFDLKENPTVRELLERAAAGLTPAQIEAKFPGQPEIQASILDTVGEAYRSIGAEDKALAHLTRAYDTIRQVHPADHSDTLASMHNLGHAYQGAGKVNRAIELLEHVRDVRVKKFGPDDLGAINTMNSLGFAYLEAGKLTEAIALYEKVRAVREKKHEPGHPHVIAVLIELGIAYRETGKVQKAIAIHEHVRQVSKLRPDHPWMLGNLSHLGLAYLEAEELPRALELLELARATGEKKFGAGHPNTVFFMNNLGWAYEHAGELDRAVNLYETARDIIGKNYGAEHPAMLTTLHRLAGAYVKTGKADQAVGLLEQVRDGRVKRFGGDHSKTLEAMNSLAVAYGKAKKVPQAIALLNQLRKIWVLPYLGVLTDVQYLFGPGAISMENSRFSSGREVASGDQPNSSKKAISRTFTLRNGRTKICLKKFAADDPRTLVVLENLARGYGKAGKGQLAIELFEQVRDGRMKKLGGDDPKTLLTLRELAQEYELARQYDKAEPLWEYTVRKWKVLRGPGHPDTLPHMNHLGFVYWKQRKFDQSVPVWEELLRSSAKSLGPDHRRTIEAAFNLAVNYRDAGQIGKAVNLCDQWLPRARQSPGPAYATLETAHQVAVDTYTRAKRFDRLEPLFDELIKLARKRTGPDHLGPLDRIRNLGKSYWLQNKLDKSILLFEETLRIGEAKLGADHHRTIQAAFNLAVNLRDAGRIDKAVRLCDQWLPRTLPSQGKTHPERDFAVQAAFETYSAAKRYDQAEPPLRELVEFAKKQDGAESPQYAAMLATLGHNLIQQQKPAEAELPLRTSLKLREMVQPQHWTTFNTRVLLGAALLGQKKYAAAEPLLRKGCEAMREGEADLPPPARHCLTEAVTFLVRLYEETNQQEKAEAWREKLQKVKAPR